MYGIYIYILKSIIISFKVILGTTFVIYTVKTFILKMYVY